MIGAATAVPLEAETEEVKAPYRARVFDPAEVFYFGESVLLPEWRGRGIGVRFFEERKASARALGRFRQLSFAAVVRAPDDPRRPPGYTPLDGFWRRRGFSPVDCLTTNITWKEIGEAAETPKPLQAWMKPLAQGSRA